MDPTLGSLYHVEMSDRTWHVAEIIQKRESLEAKGMEYYVHYKECKSRKKKNPDRSNYHTYNYTVNRRMDEWVGLERIALEEGSIEEAPKEDTLLDKLNGRDRTVTRNIKRRHDEINHIQKVSPPGCHAHSTDPSPPADIRRDGPYHRCTRERT